nr:ferritin-like fold-containing protein [Arthrobacter alpinus]
MLTSLLRTMLAEDPRLSSRLALWGRRMVGEALTQVQRIGAKHSFLVGCARTPHMSRLRQRYRPS